MPSLNVQISEEGGRLAEGTVLTDVGRETVIHRLLTEGLQSLWIDIAVERYLTGKLSVNQATRLAKSGKRFKIARKRNPTSQQTPVDLKTDIEAAYDIRKSDRNRDIQK